MKTAKDKLTVNCQLWQRPRFWLVFKGIKEYFHSLSEVRKFASDNKFSKRLKIRFKYEGKS